jgi:UDP-N-acetylmuramoyl-tripeptide--D-alanyl-D-alanine ligase
MAELNLREIALRTGGEIRQGDPSLLFSSFNIDSRLSQPGELFFAIVAKRNGHDFVPDAFAKGARGAVVSQDIASASPSLAVVLVPDTVAALQALARSVLAEHAPKVVGITGSIGKTTTKEFTAALLSPRYKVLKSEGNFNNHLGLALSLLKLQPGQQAAVLEMGTSGPGEIRALTRIAPPDIAVITNINAVHLAFFHSLEATASAKKEILDGAKESATAVLNGDDPLVQKISREWRGRRLSFGFSPACDVRASGLRKLGADGMTFELNLEGRAKRVRFAFFYEEYLSNLLAAVGAGHALSVPFEAMADEIPRLSPFLGRGGLIQLGRGLRIIDDSYNSNPRALEAALRGLVSLPAKRRVAVLGDMLELGPTEADFHRQAGRQVAVNGWNLLLAVGPLARYIAEGAAAAGMPTARIMTCANSDEAAALVSTLIEDGDLILVKGSRGIRIERVVEKLKDNFEES